MCGIAGWLYIPGLAPPAQALDRKAQSVRHRGPDDAGFFNEEASGLGLAHRRLSIIDLAAAWRLLLPELWSQDCLQPRTA